MSKQLSAYLWAWTEVEKGSKSIDLLKKYHPDADVFINVDYDGSIDEYTEYGKSIGATVTNHKFQVGYCGDFFDVIIGKPCWTRDETFEWIRSFYEACKKTDSTYMIILEEDNFLLRPLSFLDDEFSILIHASMPSAAGNNRPNHLPKRFMEFSNEHGGISTAPGYGAGGGCVLNREQFIKSWEKAEPLLYDVYDDFAKIDKIIGWQDFIVQYIMMIGGYTVDQLNIAAQPWEEANWRTKPNWKGNPYEMVCGLKEIEEIREL